MITKLIMGLLNLITKIVGIIMLPIDSIVMALIPDLGNTIQNISYYLNLPSQYMGWIFQLVNVPNAALALIISYWVFKYAVVGATAGVKKVITLYQRFKF